MNVFFDTEFTGLCQNANLISIGIVSEKGDEFYSEIRDYPDTDLSDWMKENVIANLTGKNTVSQEELKRQIEDFLAPFAPVMLWADCPSYDWVLFCELFGGALFLPKNIFPNPGDIQTLFLSKGFPADIDREEFTGMTGKRHNALYDARLAKACFEKLIRLEQHLPGKRGIPRF